MFSVVADLVYLCILVSFPSTMQSVLSDPCFMPWHQYRSLVLPFQSIEHCPENGSYSHSTRVWLSQLFRRNVARSTCFGSEVTGRLCTQLCFLFRRKQKSVSSSGLKEAEKELFTCSCTEPQLRSVVQQYGHLEELWIISSTHPLQGTTHPAEKERKKGSCISNSIHMLFESVIYPVRGQIWAKINMIVVLPLFCHQAQHLHTYQIGSNN